ncbi:MAG: metal-dependent hydrolase [Tissierellaceae bacterium]|nr:metal-dependent hydrolase [Tissierellaceae bacterium]
MTGKTHIAIGIVAGLTISAELPLENQLILISASALGSLIPDLDHPKAKLNQKLLFIKNKLYRTLFYLSISAGFLQLYVNTQNNIFSLLGFTSFFIGISSHRSFTHSIIGFLASISIVKLFAVKFNLPYIYNGFVIGYASHLVADFFTIKGIKLFYPSKTNISSPIIIKTNNCLENLIFVLLSLYSIILLFNNVMV